MNNDRCIMPRKMLGVEFHNGMILSVVILWTMKSGQRIRDGIRDYALAFLFKKSENRTPEQTYVVEMAPSLEPGLPPTLV